MRASANHFDHLIFERFFQAAGIIERAMLGDAELLRRYAVYREQTAFAELVERHLAFVYRIAARQLAGNSHFAEESGATIQERR